MQKILGKKPGIGNIDLSTRLWGILTTHEFDMGNPGMFKDGMNFFGRNPLERFWIERDGEQELAVHNWPYRDSMDDLAISSPYVMKEIFVTCLLTLEHIQEQWALEWCDRAFSYSYEKPLEWPYRDTLHQPLGVMFCLEILNRMIERKGRVSDFFDKG